MRGGTSRCLVFHEADLPGAGPARDRILLAALGRIHNTNTRKLIVAHVPVTDGEAAVEGDFELAGVPGRGARIALDFLDPGGAGTGRLLPTGKPRDVVDGVEASLVDATNPVVFVRAKDVGLAGTETPQSIDADRSVSARLEAIRVEAARPCVGRAADRRRGERPRRGAPGRAGHRLPDGAPAHGGLRPDPVTALY